MNLQPHHPTQAMEHKNIMNSLHSTTPQVQVVTASKNLVDKLLSMNTKNRKPKDAHIRQLATDIQNGNFQLTASGIGVSDTGILLDGQNRLMAIRMAGYPPVKFVLATGLKEESQKVVDRHSKRSLSDALTMHMNITVSNAMVALGAALYYFSATKKPDNPFTFGKSGGLSDSLMAEFMAEHGDLAAEVVCASGSARAPVMTAFFVYALHKKEMALEFAREVHKGANLPEDSPAYRLRASINRMKRATDAAGRMELFKLSASACMAHSSGRQMKLLRPADSWTNCGWQWAISGESIFDMDA